MSHGSDFEGQLHPAFTRREATSAEWNTEGAPVARRPFGSELFDQALNRGKADAPT